MVLKTSILTLILSLPETPRRKLRSKNRKKNRRVAAAEKVKSISVLP